MSSKSRSLQNCLHCSPFLDPVPDYDYSALIWCVFSPDDSPWEGGTFQLLVEFTEEYPNKAPKVRFVTKMYHPNSELLSDHPEPMTLLCSVYADGSICLDILQNQWSPIYDISAILTSIQVLFLCPLCRSHSYHACHSDV